MAGEQLMTVRQFGARVGVPRSTAYDIVRTGRVDVTDIGTRKRKRLRISEAALVRYVKNNQIKGRKSGAAERVA